MEKFDKNGVAINYGNYVKTRSGTGFIYTVWQGDTLSNNLDIFLVCWVNEDGIPCSIDYKKSEVLEYLESGQWRVLE